MTQVLVVGGGLVGLATAYSLVQRGIRVTVVEKEDAWARHQSSHTYGVVHSGIFCRAGSLDLRLTTTGGRALARFCADHGVPYQQTGKLVVATTENEVPRLHAVARQAASKNVAATMLTRAQLREREPHIVGVAGLWVAETAVCDYAALAGALVDELRSGGAELLTGTTALRVYERSGRAHALVQGERTRGLAASQAVVCAGLFADRLYPSRPGAAGSMRIAPFRQEYAELRPQAAALVNGLVYSVPDRQSPFQGVHLSRTVDGRVQVGLSVVPAMSREGYRWRDVDAGDLRESLLFSGTWRLARRNLKFAVGEMTRSLVRPALVRSVRKLLPEITSSDLVPGGAGVRAQAVRSDGSFVTDFEIRRVGPVVHVLGTPSSAATASLALGEHIAQLL